MKKLILTFIVLAMRSLTFAAAADDANLAAQKEAVAMASQQTLAAAALRSPSATHTCSFDFTTGNPYTLLHYCVTANGNIAQLETPQSIEFIAKGPVGEGYGMCDATSGTRYFDYADFGDSGNWGPPQVVMHNATTVKIARTTTDGIFTLTQTITQVPGILAWVKVAMALKNNSGITRPVVLLRYADVDADGLLQNNFDSTTDSAFGWNSLESGGAGFGLVIQNVGKSPVTFIPLSLAQPQGPDPCILTFGSSLQANTDGSIGMVYELSIPKGATSTVTSSYRGM